MMNHSAALSLDVLDQNPDSLEMSELRIEDSQKLENFLTLVFGDKMRDAARSDIAASFSKAPFKHRFLVSKYEDEIIAAISYGEEMFHINTWGISWGSVHPDWRHQGILESIGKECARQISRLITVPSTLIVATVKDKASFYRKMGFKGTTLDCSGGSILTQTIYPA